MEERMRYSLKIKVNDIGNGEYEYIAQYDQFPTIIGVGDSPNEALEEAQIFLEEYLDYCKQEGIAVPKAESNEWKDNYSGKITVRLPKALHRDLDIYSEEDGMSINSIINDAIRVYLFQRNVSQIVENALEVFNEYSAQINDARLGTLSNIYWGQRKFNLQEKGEEQWVTELN